MPTIPKPTRKSYLPERKAQARRLHPNSEFYRGWQWRRVRANYLQHYPLCAECAAQGRITPARVVDHIKPINEGGARYDFRNLQGLCDKCHNSKSGREAHRSNAKEESKR